MRYKAVIFDMNGTLINDEPLQEKSVVFALNTIGVKITHDDFLQYFIGRKNATNFTNFIRKSDANISLAKILKIKEQEYNRLREKYGIETFDGIKESLDFLNQQGIKLAVATSTKRDESIANLRIIGLFNYFDVIICAEDVVKSKPDPESYLLAIEKLGIQPFNSIIIEDAVAGVEAAHATGAFTIANLNSFSKKALTDAGADLVVQEITPQIFQSLKN